MLSTIDSINALRTGAVGFREQREVVRVVGPDTWSYLEGQCTQSLTGMANGEARDAFLLSPKGHVEALVRVIAQGDESALVEVEAGYGELVEQRLRRFKIRVKADLQLEAWHCLHLLGPRSSAATTASSVVAQLNWPGIVGVDHLDRDPPELIGIEEGDPQAFELERIIAGWPRLAHELSDEPIPQETGIVDRTVSFTKGCYTGQELVARLDPRGDRVPQRLCGLRIEKAQGHEIAQRQPLEHDGRELGLVTSVAEFVGGEGLVGLGYVRREVEVGAELDVVATDGAALRVRIEALPLAQS